MKRHVAVLALAALLPIGIAGCGDEAPKKLAPTAEGSSLAASKPKSENAKKWSIDASQSKVEFAMEAPKEKIRGRVPGGVSGELYIDPQNLAATTGTIAADLSTLELYQRKADEGDQFGEESKSDLQNKHARSWLEIDDSAPEDMRKKNARVEFAIRSIEAASANDVTKLSGPERKVTLKAKGDFLLHGRQQPKEAELEVTFKYEGDKPVRVSVKSVKPMSIGLAEFDVRPREAFGKLAEKTLDALSPKVAKEAPIVVELSLVMGDAPAGSASAAPAASAPPADASASAAPADSAAPAASGSAAPATSAAPAASASASPAASAAPAASAKPKK
jgi:hypothetical protein